MDRVVLRDDGLTEGNAGSPQTITKQVTFFILVLCVKSESLCTTPLVPFKLSQAVEG
jgi:hypothetical protein